MPINPHTNEVLATSWGDQFSAAIRERSTALFEETLHTFGLCSHEIPDAAYMLFDYALECGAVAMGLELEEQGRLKEVES